MIKQHHAKPIFEVHPIHGEGIIWEEHSQCINLVDILEGQYFSIDVNAQQVRTYDVGQALGVMAHRTNGGVVVAVRDGFGLMNSVGGKMQLIEPSPEQNNPKVRFNDGAVSPDGRFFAGTMEWDGKEPIAKLFRLDSDYSWTALEDNIWISNGIAWNVAGNQMYYIDTLTHAVAVYDYDANTGSIRNKRTHLKFSEEEFPDGMCMDSEDGMWIAFWGLGKVAYFDQNGIRREEVHVPLPHPTSCCLGGVDLKTLYISTSRVALSEDQQKQYPLAGRVFVHQANIKGKIEPKFKG